MTLEEAILKVKELNVDKDLENEMIFGLKNAAKDNPDISESEFKLIKSFAPQSLKLKKEYKELNEQYFNVELARKMATELGYEEDLYQGHDVIVFYKNKGSLSYNIIFAFDRIAKIHFQTSVNFSDESIDFAFLEQVQTDAIQILKKCIIHHENEGD